MSYSVRTYCDDEVGVRAHYAHVRAVVEFRERGRCFYCREPLPNNWIVEHVQPRSAGGTDALCNLVAACRSCNTIKGDRVYPWVAQVQRQLADWESALWDDARVDRELRLQEETYLG